VDAALVMADIEAAVRLVQQALTRGPARE
jgi:hypothetical protein